MASIYFEVFHIMKIKSEANSGGRIFMMKSLRKEIDTVELHHYTTHVTPE